MYGAAVSVFKLLDFLVKQLFAAADSGIFAFTSLYILDKNQLVCAMHLFIKDFENKLFKLKVHYRHCGHPSLHTLRRGGFE